MDQVPAISVDRSVVIAGKVFQTEARCGYRAFVCHPASRPDSGDLVVVLPDDFTQLKASVSVWQPARLSETWVECLQSISVNEPPTLQSSQRRQ